MELFNRLVNRFMKFQRRARRFYRVFFSLTMIVVFVTTYALILPALTLDEDETKRQPGITIEGNQGNAEVSEEDISAETMAADSQTDINSIETLAAKESEEGSEDGASAADAQNVTGSGENAPERGGTEDASSSVEQSSANEDASDHSSENGSDDSEENPAPADEGENVSASGNNDQSGTEETDQPSTQDDEQNNAEGDDTPADDEEKPAEDNEKPADGDEEPAGDNEQSSDGDEMPAEDDEQSVDGDDKPAEDNEKSTEDEDQSSAEDNQPGTAEDTEENPTDDAPSVFSLTLETAQYDVLVSFKEGPGVPEGTELKVREIKNVAPDHKAKGDTFQEERGTGNNTQEDTANAVVSQKAIPQEDTEDADAAEKVIPQDNPANADAAQKAILQDDAAYLPCFLAVRSSFDELKAGEIREEHLYEISFIRDGEVFIPDEQSMDVCITYKKNTYSHADDLVNACIFTGALPGSDSQDPVRAVFVPKNADHTDIITLADGIITTMEMKDLPLAPEGTLLGLFAAEKPAGEYPEAVFDQTVKTINVHVEAPEGAFPEGTTMVVKPVKASKVLDAVQEAVGENSEVTSATALDITFFDPEGVEVQPLKEIRVSFSTTGEESLEDSKIVHIDDAGEGTVVESTMEDDAAVISVDGFSIYAIVYTVDFHWDVNGQTFDFSIPGGGFVSFYDLVKALEIETDDPATEEDEIQALVDGVESIAFSNPELVSVSKVEEDSTVGAIKERLGLECEYSAELTEEEIAEINAQIVRGGDWAVIGLEPFTSEETLTVTMANGDQWAVKVTDEQATDYPANEGKYLIYYTSGNYHYVLKNDGTTQRVATSNEAQLDTLGDEYLWTFELHNRFGADYYLIHNESTYITLNGSSAGIFSNTATPVYLDEYGDGRGGFYVYGAERTGSYSYKYNFLAYDGGFTRVDDPNSNHLRIKLWDQETRRYHFTVKTEYNNIFRGTVSGRDAGNTQQTNVPSFVGITSNNKTNSSQITATAGEGYRFKEWRLGGTVLEGYGRTIQAGQLTFSEDNMVLTAVFEKDPDNPNAGVADYKETIENWKAENMDQPLELNKTAQVSDYDNRIYEIGLTAFAKAKAVENDVELVFVTDISRSMYTPAELRQVATYTSKADLINKLNNLRDRGTYGVDGDPVYYLMGNESTSALIFATRKFNNSTYRDWKWIDCSYDTTTYQDKKGTQGVTGVDKTWDDGTNGSGYLYQRIVESNGSMTLQGLELNGKIYVAQDFRYRLDYLQQAVDIVSDVIYTINPDAKTGLVTFAGTAQGPYGMFGRDQYGDLITALNSVDPKGDTNQAAGLNLASGIWDTPADSNHQRVVMLITDGAPNGGVTWQQIQTAAQNLHNQTGAIVHTVGLSVNNVQGAQSGLEATAAAGGGGDTMMPENGTALVRDVLEIVSTYLKDCSYKGTLHDDIDSAFYPVSRDGSPIEPNYYDLDGNPLTMAEVKALNAAGTEYYLWSYNDSSWSITWYNIEFGRGTAESPATQKKIYVKAREDFMGGNKINTNIEGAHAIATKAVFDSGKEQPLEEVKDAMAETPYVNVDELHLTEHSTEWTVYLGTDVKPEDQLKALWDNIKVKQVVKKDGTDPEDVTAIGSRDSLYYAHSNAMNGADTAPPTQNETPASSACSKLPLSHYGLNTYYDALLSAITSGTSYDSGNISYEAYGHTAGNFRITATKVIAAGATDAVGKAPGQHTTDVTGAPVEQYEIKVTYTPLTTDASTTYAHTTAEGSAGNVTTGTGADEVKSTNEHKINVIKKGLEIRKYDDSGSQITDKPATFKLYRPAQTGETGSNVTGLGEGYVEVATLTTNGGSASVADTLMELRKLPADQHYYLVETQEPDGYIKLTAPIQIDLSVTEGEQTKPYVAAELITDLVNVGTPSAVISVTDENAEVLSDSDGRLVLKVINRSGSADITIHKVNERNEPLPDAVFKLTKGAEIVVISSSGTGVVVEPKVVGETVTIEKNTFTIPEGGVVIRNLPASDTAYAIVEVAPPEGYVITDNTPATFKVTAGNIADVQHVTGVTYTPETGDFTIPNRPGAELPNTGGPGTTSLYLLGILLTALAGVGMGMRRKTY